MGDKISLSWSSRMVDKMAASGCIVRVGHSSRDLRYQLKNEDLCDELLRDDVKLCRLIWPGSHGDSPVPSEDAAEAHAGVLEVSQTELEANDAKLGSAQSRAEVTLPDTTADEKMPVLPSFLENGGHSPPGQGRARSLVKLRSDVVGKEEAGKIEEAVFSPPPPAPVASMVSEEKEVQRGLIKLSMASVENLVWMRPYIQKMATLEAEVQGLRKQLEEIKSLSSDTLQILKKLL